MATRAKSGTTTTYSYDPENHLTKVVAGSTTQAQFAYDGDGGRTKKIAGATTIWYVGNLYEDNGSLTTKHIYLGSTEVAAVTNGTTTLYYHQDHLGGTNVTVDVNGVKKEVAEYLPFGGFSRHDKYGSSSEVAWFYFTGKKLDDETGLYYYGARYYDPSLGRFITADTIVQAPDNPQTLNRYSYANNNPVNNIDPTGHSWFSKLFKSFAKALIQAVAYVVLSPIITPVGAGALIGFVTGGLTDNGWSWNGAFLGAGLGALGGAAFGTTGTNGFLGALGPKVGLGLLAVGAGYSAATGGLEGLANFGASVAGAVVGGGIGNSINKAIQSRAAPTGINQAQEKAGVKQPIGNEDNSGTKTLNINQGAKASQEQALDSPNKDIVGYESKTLHFEKSGNPLEGAQYHDRVIQRLPGNAIKPDFHSFPQQVENFAVDARVDKIIYSDGSFRTIISVQGSYKGQNGSFEWIKTQDNTIIHRFFKPD